ncbi:MAG: US12 family protein [Lachnospiraceae bacterium]|nr:US12 family protein [Lachnospiraceae bacterium]
MADQGTNYFNGNMGTAAEQQAAAQQQQQQSQSTADLLAATSGAIHVNLAELTAQGADEISAEKYNTIIGLMLLYGFAVNAIMCFAFGDSIIGLFGEIPYWAFMLGYLACCFAGMVICNNTKSPVVGFLGYNLFVVPMGVLLTPFLRAFEIETIRYAFCVMGICMMLMIGLAQLYPKFFLSIGRMLFACFIIGILGEVILWCFGFTSGIFDFIFVGIFLAYIGYDWADAQSRQKTTRNAVSVSYMIYVDLINLLIRLLRIIARNRD